MAGSHTYQIKEIIRAFNLVPHIEGGYYRELYTSDRLMASESSFGSSRCLASHIYYLLCCGERSKIHSLDADEMFHHYGGGPLMIVELMLDSEPKFTVLGDRVVDGETPWHIVRAGTWFGAFVTEEHDYSFVGCTVVPAFEWNTFRLGEKDELCRLFPHCYALIEMFF